MLKDVGTAVPKTTEMGCRDGSVQQNKDYTSNPIPTSFFIPDMILQAMHAIRLLRIAVGSKKDVGMGLLV